MKSFEKATATAMSVFFRPAHPTQLSVLSCTISVDAVAIRNQIARFSLPLALFLSFFLPCGPVCQRTDLLCFYVYSAPIYKERDLFVSGEYTCIRSTVWFVLLSDAASFVTGFWGCITLLLYHHIGQHICSILDGYVDYLTERILMAVHKQTWMQRNHK